MADKVKTPKDEDKLEMDSGLIWPQFDSMTKEEKARYYEEHPFRYTSVEEYTEDIRRWVRIMYKDVTDDYIEWRIGSEPEMIRGFFKRKVPIDLAAVDVMYVCG